VTWLRPRRRERRYGDAPFLVIGILAPNAPGQTGFRCDQCGRKTYLDRDRAKALMADGAVIRCIDCIACGG
jgi:hypothetical protein